MATANNTAPVTTARKSPREEMTEGVQAAIGAVLAARPDLHARLRFKLGDTRYRYLLGPDGVLRYNKNLIVNLEELRYLELCRIHATLIQLA